MAKDASITTASSKGLFDTIIVAIKQEQESEKTKKLLGTFIVFLDFSIAWLPFSLSLLLREWRQSGVPYFIVTAFAHPMLFFAYWQDFLLSIIESLPVEAILIFFINLALLLFTVRLFLYKR